jgi:hypothetical protein
MELKCKNCGAEDSIHHYNTMQCPYGGIESPPGRRQVWLKTVYTPDTESLENRVEKLERLVAKLMEKNL